MNFAIQYNLLDTNQEPLLTILHFKEWLKSTRLVILRFVSIVQMNKPMKIFHLWNYAKIAKFKIVISFKKMKNPTWWI